MTTAEPELGFLLEDFQTPDPQLADRFNEVARSILRRIAAKRSYGLSDDVINDVVQEAFLSLLNPNLVRFDSSRGTASHYLQGRVLNAVKTTQVAYGLRRTGSDFEAEPQREYVPIDDEMPLVSTHGVDVDAILARQSLEKLFANVDRSIFDACVRVYGDDESQSAVAEEMNISRFALARQMTAANAAAAQILMAA
jgi:hypothetical protein